MAKSIYYCLFTVLILLSCKKNNEEITYEFQINTIDAHSSAAIEGITVKAYTKGIKSGTYSSAFELRSSETSNSSGITKINIPFSSLDVIKFEYAASEYFSEFFEYNPDDFSTENVNVISQPLEKKGQVRIHIKNSFPINSLDKITFNSINSDCGRCDKFNSLEYIGDAVDITLNGMTVQNRYFKYQYIVEKSGTTTTLLDSTYCDSDTSIIEVFY